MSNNDIWLRKIAAFLHDPPYKVWYFGKEYLGQVWRRDSDVIEIFQRYVSPNYPFKDPRNSDKIGLRVFHHVAASAGKNHYFGIKGPKIIFDFGGYIFIHSLSGEPISLNEILGAPPTQIFDPKSEVERFLSALTGDEREKFLRLWRNLPSDITIWVNLLPIDTVLPDNTTRDLDVIQSALITAWDGLTSLDKKESIKPSFLTLEFGPVQKFIANARKTRDLWFSSWLISYLSWQAIKEIANELGPDNIVYPDLYKQPLVDDWLEKERVLSDKDWDKKTLKLPTLPNTFLAIVKEGDEKKFADAAKNALSKTWEDLVEIIPNVETKRKGDDGRHLKLKEIWGDEVVDKFLSRAREFPFDVYWLGLKWGNDPEKAIEDYKSLFTPDNKWAFGELWSHIKDKNPNVGDTYELLVQMAQTGLKALKYRGRPQAVEEPGYKCTLCGERTVLTDGDPNDINGIKNFWKQMADAFPGHIKENEHLCAVCLVKRLAPKAVSQNSEKYFESGVADFDYHFPSTGSIAIAPFINSMINSGIDFSPIKSSIETLLEQQKGQELKKTIKNFLDAHFTEGRTVPGIGNRVIPEKIAGEDFRGDFEPEWFYDESFQRFYDELKHQSGQDAESQDEFKKKRQWAEQIERAVNQIKNIAKERLGDKYNLPKYYAAIYLDGDNLGKWLSGEKAPKIEDVFHPDFVKAVSNNQDFQNIKDLKRPVTPAIHRAISSALRDFALEVVPYVVEHNLGVVVYSGGDDTLFLMPLENLLDTILTLRKLYSGERYSYETDSRKFESDKGFIKIYEKDGNGYRLKEIIRVMGTKATLSAGIAIAHYLDPLDITLSKAHGALEAAKNKDDEKDKAGFKLMLHSGNESEAIVPWNFVEAMKEFKRAIESGLSSRFLRTLYREASVYNSLEDAFDAEFLKFGKRGQPDSGEVELLLRNLIDARKQNKLKPDEFLKALLITDFLVRGEDSK